MTKQATNESAATTARTDEPTLPVSPTRWSNNYAGNAHIEVESEHQQTVCRNRTDLDGFITDVTTIAQSRCEHTTDYADIETLVCRLPIDHLTLTAHDALAPYSGPYPMTLLVRAFLIEEING